MARVGSPVGQSGTGMSGKWRLLNLCKQACSCAALSLSLSLFLSCGHCRPSMIHIKLAISCTSTFQFKLCSVCAIHRCPIVPFCVFEFA